MVITLGLSNARQAFQRYINYALVDLTIIYAYIDDIPIASSSPEEHEMDLRIVFERLKRFSLRTNLDECQFRKSGLEFLGYLVYSDGWAPIPEKMRAIT